ncbi:MAG: DUF475 domain-containing protein [archaeon]|jgi:hypothetical protein
MDIVSIILVVFGLCLFETINSVDNAIINADVLKGMSKWARKWFLFWGLIIAVFVVRGLLPWLIVWATVPSLGPIGALTATFSSDPKVISAIASAAPFLLAGAGTFLVFLFFHWLFMEPKNYAHHHERFFHAQWVWFYAVVSVLLASLVWFALQYNPSLALAAVIGSTAFFIMHGFKQNVEKHEHNLVKSKGAFMSDVSKLMYLEIIDATFSIDGVLGAFAFTLAVPLIILGNGLGAFVVREITISNIENIKKYAYLKNGAMYSIFFLGAIMLLDAFGFEIPSIISPVMTFLIVGYFFYRSWSELKKLHHLETNGKELAKPVKKKSKK